jgi:DNA modification methylase
MIDIRIGDCRDILKTLPSESVDCVVTSPPYFNLRSYLPEDHPDKLKEIGTEKTPEEYVNNLVDIFREVKRVLRDDGTFWLNISSSYAGSGKGIGSDHGKAVFTDDNIVKTNWKNIGYKPQELIPIPWLVAIELKKDGWKLIQDIIWTKDNCQPESVTKRCTKSHEYILLFVKSQKYFYDNEAIKEPTVSKDKSIRNRDAGKLNNVPGRAKMKGLKTNDYDFRNKRSVWRINTVSYSGAHFACFPPKLAETCILAGCPKNGTVLDPFGGSGTVGEVCNALGRNAILIELNPDYKKLILERTGQSLANFGGVL